MKKFVLSLMTIGAMFFATQNLHAQEEEEEVEEIEVETEIETEVEHEYESVEIDDLPQAVTDAIMADYNGATATHAWVITKDDQKLFKLKIDVNGELKKVYITEDGTWVEKEHKPMEE